MLQKIFEPHISVESVIHALDDGTRRAIVQALTKKPHSVTRLADSLGITTTAVGQHVEILERSGLVSTKKTGRVRECRLNASGLTVLEEWAREHRRMWEKRLNRLGKLLEEDEAE